MRKKHAARLTAGGPTWDLRPSRQPGGGTGNRDALPTRPADALAHVRRNLTWLAEALRDGREGRARELLKESRFLVRRFPDVTDQTVRGQLAAAATLLRSPAWQEHAARRRHGRPG
ncbi:hypothetical protein AB0K93_03225 [Streptomyces sp. NPDC052676]|uniref:hypothetical protein n=1 Tax=Streptomyces sp. NPDC052676 TaxID=3154953 RepID=UPI0034388E9F